MTDKIIIDTSDEAAKPHTIDGWISSRGIFFKDEDMARFDGCTHRACRDCGEPVKKSWLICDKCRHEADQAQFDALPKDRWDGHSMIYSESAERYFRGPDDALDYLESEREEGDTSGLESLRLVICDPQYLSEIDPNDHYVDVIPEDGDLPNWVENAFRILNATIREHRGDPVCWYPGKKALLIETKEERAA